MIVSLLFAVESWGQSKNLVTDTLWVNGICGMCKKRIETAVTYEKGVQSANWDMATDILTVTFRSDKTDKKKLASHIAAAGHDNSWFKAPDAAYNRIHNCCRYRADAKH